MMPREMRIMIVVIFQQSTGSTPSGQSGPTAASRVGTGCRRKAAPVPTPPLNTGGGTATTKGSLKKHRHATWAYAVSMKS